MRTRLIVFFLCITFFSSCGGDSESVATEETNSSEEAEKIVEQSLEYKTETLLETLDDCIPDSSKCTYIKISYPKFSQAPNEKADKLNDLIQQKLLAAGGEMMEQDLGTMAKNFIKSYQEFLEKMPEYNLPWYENKEVSVVYDSPKLVCLSFSNSAYMGGAHGMYYTEYVNVNLNTGEVIRLEQIFKDDYKEGLDKLIDEKIRKTEKLKDIEDLTEAGIYENKVKTNKNFALVDKGMMFFYNAYEIAPFASGTFEVVIPYKDLKPLLRDETIINP